MNSTDPIPKKDRQERIEELLKLIGGLESSIYLAMEDRDYKTVDLLKPMRLKYYKKLRRVVNGLPENEGLQPEKAS